MNAGTVHLRRTGAGTYFDLLFWPELAEHAGRILQVAGPIMVAHTDQAAFLCEIGGDEDMDKKGRTPRSIKECPHNPGVSCDLWKNEPQRCSACSWNEDKAAEAPPEAE